MWNLWYNDIAAGTFVPNSAKALPQCNDVDVAAISSSVYATLNSMQVSLIQGTHSTGKSIRPTLRKKRRIAESSAYFTSKLWLRYHFQAPKHIQFSGREPRGWCGRA
jgi:hypothetical protein